MEYDPPLSEATLLRRYKRFLADIRLPSGEEVVAHCANSGRMTACWEPNIPCRVSFHDNPKRKLKWSLEQTKMNGTWVVVNTSLPNRVVEEGIASGLVPELADWPVVEREKTFGASRIDLRLRDGERTCWVEVKNVTLFDEESPRGRVSGQGLFPDAVSERATKHIDELARIVEEGHRAVLFFHVGRGDIEVVSPADAIDPEYGKAIRRATAAGVEVLAYRCDVDAAGLKLVDRLAVDLG